MTGDKITKDMAIGEMLTRYPQTAEVLSKYGFHCLGCFAASYESIGEGAIAHGLDAKKLMADLNKAIAGKIEKIEKKQKK